jgi:hypothetical protein
MRKLKMFITMKEASAMHRWYKLLSAACRILHAKSARLQKENQTYSYWKDACHRWQEGTKIASKVHRQWEKAMYRVLKCQGHPSFVNKKGI